MSADGYVYDTSTTTEGTPQIFVKKEWVSLLDNQSGNYSGNQFTLDTSSISNSNKWASWKEAYLTIPVMLVASNRAGNAGGNNLVNPSLPASSCNMAFGLKNSFLSLIDSMTVNFNGTTIIQRTGFSNIYNNFR